MGAIAALLIAVGIIALIYGGMQKFKASRMNKAAFVPTGDAASKGEQVAGEKGAISAEGSVECAQPLTSPVTGKPCLYYELKVVGTWKEGDSNKSKDYVNDKAAAEFSINDGSGAVRVFADQGGTFDLEKTFDETKKEGFFADIKNLAGAKEPIMFGSYAFENPPMSKANTFQCIEKILPVSPKLYAMGKSENNAIVTPKWTSLVLSAKGREELLGEAAKHAQYALIGGGAGVGVGILLGIINAVMSG